MKRLRPSNFAVFPEQSKCWKMEPEKVAENIMVILARTGNEFRELTFEEYREERIKDGDFNKSEEDRFYSVKEYCLSPESAMEFSPAWNEVFVGNFMERMFSRYTHSTSSPFFNKENEL